MKLLLIALLLVAFVTQANDYETPRSMTDQMEQSYHDMQNEIEQMRRDRLEQDYRDQQLRLDAQRNRELNQIKWELINDRY